MTAISLGTVRACRSTIAVLWLAGLSALWEPVTGQITVAGIVAEVGVRGGASVRWDAVAGATRYFVVRWNAGDAACCKRISPLNASGPTLSWQDELPKAGTYGYRVYATTPTGTYAGEVRLNFIPGTISSSTGYVAPAGSGSIKEPVPNSTPTGVIATANSQPELLILKVAGPASLTTTSLAPDGVGILLNWTAVPNAVSYRIYRTIAGSGAQASQINWLDRGPRPPRGSLRGIDVEVGLETNYSYWVEALFADGSASAPSPVSTVNSQGFFSLAVSNLRATVGGTTSIVMPAPLSIRGAIPGSYVTWVWDPLPAVYRYEISYEIVGGVDGFGPVVERAMVATASEPPTPAPVLRPVPQGKSVKFCVATFPQPVDPTQPLAELELFGRTFGGPVRCITTQVP